MTRHSTKTCAVLAVVTAAACVGLFAFGDAGRYAGGWVAIAIALGLAVTRRRSSRHPGDGKDR